MSDLLPFLPAFLAAYAILVVGASSPGPAVAMLLGIGLSKGRGPSLWATFGIATGGVLLNIGTLLGVGLILAQAAWAMTALRLIGSAYLLWLAYGAFKKAAQGTEVTVAEAPNRSNAGYFAMGFLLQATNPKAIVFWLAIASVGATAGGGLAVIALFVLGAFAISFTCHGAWALLLSSAPIRAAYTHMRRSIEAVLGVLFTVFAIKLVLARG